VNACLLVFARAPVPGAAKTRLAPALGQLGASRLHAALVRSTVATAAAAEPLRLELWLAGADAGGFAAGLAEEFDLALFAQQGGDLGARMAHALARGTGDASPCIIIGTDCPTLGAATLRSMAAALAERDAVIIPARDGGYVALGLHRPAEELFRGMPWGTDEVLATTRSRLAGLGWSWYELAPHADVDRPGDLAAVARLGHRWAGLCGRLPGTFG